MLTFQSNRIDIFRLVGGSIAVRRRRGRLLVVHLHLFSHLFGHLRNFLVKLKFNLSFYSYDEKEYFQAKDVVRDENAKSLRTKRENLWHFQGGSRRVLPYSQNRRNERTGTIFRNLCG